MIRRPRFPRLAHLSETRMLVVALSFGTPAFARDDSNQSTSDVVVDLEGLENLSLEDLFQVDVTTATKTQRSADEVPAMIEVVTGQDIRDRGYRHLGDVLNDLPDNHEDRSNWGIGEPLDQNVGFGYRFDTGQNTLLLFNGQRLNAFLPGNRFGIEEYVLDNVERIEIIRGPGSALYGANAFTSVINIISKNHMDPDEEPYARASVGGIATAGGTNGQVSWKGPLSADSFFSGAVRLAQEQGQELYVANDLFGDNTVRDGIRHDIDSDLFLSVGDLRVYSRINHQLRDAVTGFNGVQTETQPKELLLGYAFSLGADYTQDASKKLQMRYSIGAHDDNWTENGQIPIFKLNAAGNGLQLDADGYPILDQITIERDGKQITTSFPIDGQGGDTLTTDVGVQATYHYAGDNSLVLGFDGNRDQVMRVYRDTEIQISPPAFVTFHRIDDNRTRIMLQLEIQPDDMTSKVGDLLGFVRRRAAGDLKRFKELIESRGTASGAWRGDVARPNP